MYISSTHYASMRRQAEILSDTVFGKLDANFWKSYSCFSIFPDAQKFSVHIIEPNDVGIYVSSDHDFEDAGLCLLVMMIPYSL